MRVLLVSYFAEAHLSTSSAQNTRFITSGLLQMGHEVRVVCAGHTAETIQQDGYLLTKIPIMNPSWNKIWLGGWRADEKVCKIANEYFADWMPDVVYVGAWNFLSEFVFVAKDLDLPVVQLVHDYSILCMRQWLVDSWGNLCDGPTSLKKCEDCIRNGIGERDKIKDKILSLPILGPNLQTVIGSGHRHNIHVRSVVGEVYSRMQTYRDNIDLYIAQSPSVIEILQSGGVTPDRCRLLPQYIGEEKLKQYPRPETEPGVDRPLRFIYIGRWSVEKGVHLMMEAFKSAISAIPLELWVVSRNAPVDSLQSMSKEGKKVCVFTGLQGEEVSKRIAQADISIIPSICMELASRVVFEAHAQGVPVLVSNTVGNRFVIKDEINGKIFTIKDKNDIKVQIERLGTDPSIIKKWSGNISKPIGFEIWISEILAILLEAKEIKSK